MGYTGDKERRAVSISNCQTTEYNPKACEEATQKILKCARVSDRSDTSAETR